MFIVKLKPFIFASIPTRKKIKHIHAIENAHNTCLLKSPLSVRGFAVVGFDPVMVIPQNKVNFVGLYIEV